MCRSIDFRFEQIRTKNYFDHDGKLGNCFNHKNQYTQICKFDRSSKINNREVKCVYSNRLYVSEILIVVFKQYLHLY